MYHESIHALRGFVLHIKYVYIYINIYTSYPYNYLAEQMLIVSKHLSADLKQNKRYLGFAKILCMYIYIYIYIFRGQSQKYEMMQSWSHEGWLRTGPGSQMCWHRGKNLKRTRAIILDIE